MASHPLNQTLKVDCHTLFRYAFTTLHFWFKGPLHGKSFKNAMQCDKHMSSPFLLPKWFSVMASVAMCEFD
jgi:hypothetical protein